MTAKQESKLKMLLTLRLLLQANAIIVSTLPNSGEFLTMLDAAIALIQANSEYRQHNSKGVAVNKKMLRETLITLTLDGSVKLQAYARYIKDTDFFTSTKLTSTKLKAASDLELIDIVNDLYASIQMRLANLTAYGLNEVSQTTYKNAITAFTTSIPMTRQVQVDKTESTKLLNQGFDEADTALENIDALVEIVRLTQTNFYSEYKATLKIIDKSGSLQVKGTVTETATHDPIAKATLKFILEGETEIALEKQSAEKGGYMIKNLAEGIYSVKVSKIGYQTKTVAAVVSSDQLCQLDVELEKE